MIERITVKLGEKEVELSLEEARRLYRDLDDLFAKKDIPLSLPYFIPIPYLVPSRPEPRPWFTSGPIWLDVVKTGSISDFTGF